MFGYIKPYVPEMKVREHEMYRAAYCGLCKTMKKMHLGFMRTTLSYDGVYLALVRCSLDGTLPETGEGRCLLHPFRKRKIVKPNPHFEYAAGASCLLLYYKLLDDAADKKGVRSLLSRIGARVAKGQLKRAKKHLSLPENEVSDAISRLSEAEKENTPSLDRLADISGDMMKHIFACGMEENASAAESIGYDVGRWVYAIDCWDDCERDKKENNFNPLLLGEGAETNKERCKSTAAIWANRICGENLLSGKEGTATDICINIASLGMPDAFSGKK